MSQEYLSFININTISFVLQYLMCGNNVKRKDIIRNIQFVKYFH